MPVTSVPLTSIQDSDSEEFGISQPAVSIHLRVLSDSGFAAVRSDGAQGLYAIDATPFDQRLSGYSCYM